MTFTNGIEILLAGGLSVQLSPDVTVKIYTKTDTMDLVEAVLDSSNKTGANGKP